MNRLLMLVWIPLWVAITFFGGLLDAVLDTWQCVRVEVPLMWAEVWAHD